MQQKRNAQVSMPIVDEGWWEAVLAEEGSNASQRSGNHRVRGSMRGIFGSETGRAAPDWEKVKALFEGDQIVDLRVMACNKGGLLVDGDDLSGFVPYSHLVDLTGPADIEERTRLLERYVGRTLRLKVIECVPEDGRIVLSERAALAEPGKRSSIFHSLRPGERVSGIVTNITDFGVFVDLGGVEGLIHISELSWGRVLHPAKIVRLGQPVEVQVVDLSPERCRVALSLKRLLPNPWRELSECYDPKVPVQATVTSVLSYGAFARLPSGVDGLIHISEMPLADGQAVRDLVQEGATIQVRILHVDAAHQRMGLSMKVGP